MKQLKKHTTPAGSKRPLQHGRPAGAAITALGYFSRRHVVQTPTDGAASRRRLGVGVPRESPPSLYFSAPTLPASTSAASECCAPVVGLRVLGEEAVDGVDASCIAAAAGRPGGGGRERSLGRSAISGTVAARTARRGGAVNPAHRWPRAAPRSVASRAIQLALVRPGPDPDSRRSDRARDERREHEQRHAHANGDVGDVEDGPPREVDEVDDVAARAIDDVPERAADDERERRCAPVPTARGAHCRDAIAAAQREPPKRREQHRRVRDAERRETR